MGQLNTRQQTVFVLHFNCQACEGAAEMSMCHADHHEEKRLTFSMCAIMRLEGNTSSCSGIANCLHGERTYLHAFRVLEECYIYVVAEQRGSAVKYSLMLLKATRLCSSQYIFLHSESLVPVVCGMSISD